MMQRFSQEEIESHAEEGHYWISISDLMTSLLFIFILILAYTIFTFSEKSAVFEESFFNRGELLTQIQTTLRNQNIDVDIDPENGNLRLKTDGLFAVGSADLSVTGKEMMGKVADTIKSKMAENPKYLNAIDTIFIEGHTDNIPIISSYSVRRWTNMELSAQRAINTFLSMNEIAGIAQLKNRCGRYLFSYSGYADQRPVESNETEVGRSRNRRIEIFFALTSPQINSLKHCQQGVVDGI